MSLPPNKPRDFSHPVAHRECQISTPQVALAVPIGSNVNFQIKVETNIKWCPMCGWIFVPVTTARSADKKSAENTSGKPSQSEVA